MILLENQLSFQLTQAISLIELGQLLSAEQWLLPLQDEAEYQPQVQQLLQRITQQLKGQQGVPLKQIGEHYLVEAVINQQQTSELMIDTGASLTVLDLNFFNQVSHRLDASYHSELRLNTAGGVITAEVYRVAEFSIADYSVRDLKIAVVDLGRHGRYQGLLGMNFLKQFDFEIAQQQQQLLLRYK